MVLEEKKNCKNYWYLTIKNIVQFNHSPCVSATRAVVFKKIAYL